MSICLITLIFFYATSLISYKAKLHSSTYKLHWVGLVVVFIHLCKQGYLFTLEFNQLMVNSVAALDCQPTNWATSQKMAAAILLSGSVYCEVVYYHSETFYLGCVMGTFAIIYYNIGSSMDDFYVWPTEADLPTETSEEFEKSKASVEKKAGRRIQ